MTRYLAGQGLDVDLVYQGSPRTASREREFDWLRTIVRVETVEASRHDAFAREVSAFYDTFDLPPQHLTCGSALAQAVGALLDAIDYRAVIASYAWTAPVFEALERRALRIVDLHDVIHLHGERERAATGSTSGYHLPADTERFLWRRWDAVVAITPSEAEIVRANLDEGQQLRVVGHAPPLFASGPQPGRDDRVLYVGSDNSGNTAAVDWFLTAVWPSIRHECTRAEFHVAGLVCRRLSNHPMVGRDGVCLHGLAEDVAPLLADAGVVVAPYLFGTGLKIKVIEAAAAGKLIVTSPAGTDGTGLAAGTDLFVANDAAAFAAAVVTALADSCLRARVGGAALTATRAHAAPEVCYEPLLELIGDSHAHGATGRIAPGVERRLRAALAVTHRPAVALWGNGSHTRRFVRIARNTRATISRVVDGRAQSPSVTPEGLPLVPGRDFCPAAGELVVLSSQIFEAEMARDIARLCPGVEVLSLYDHALTTEPLRSRLAA